MAKAALLILTALCVAVIVGCVAAPPFWVFVIDGHPYVVMADGEVLQ